MPLILIMLNSWKRLLNSVWILADLNCVMNTQLTHSNSKAATLKDSQNTDIIYEGP